MLVQATQAKPKTLQLKKQALRECLLFHIGTFLFLFGLVWFGLVF
jgi:hypothetical protein